MLPINGVCGRSTYPSSSVCHCHDTPEAWPWEKENRRKRGSERSMETGITLPPGVIKVFNRIDKVPYLILHIKGKPGICGCFFFNWLWLNPLHFCLFSFLSSQAKLQPWENYLWMSCYLYYSYLKAIFVPKQKKNPCTQDVYTIGLHVNHFHLCILSLTIFLSLL